MCCMSSVTCHVSHVTCLVSCVMCHPSHARYHLILFFFFFSSSKFGANRWRVCYQQGLPRLVYQLFNVDLYLNFVLTFHLPRIGVFKRIHKNVCYFHAQRNYRANIISRCISLCITICLLYLLTQYGLMVDHQYPVSWNGPCIRHTRYSIYTLWDHFKR